MHAGLLSHFVNIFKGSPKTSATGALSKEWTEVKKTYAHIKTKNFREIFSADKNTVEVKTIITIRYDQDFVNKDLQVQYQGKIFKVISIDDVDFKRAWLRLSCTYD
jgi:SPP1 family predicted phage head-tail adaptor